MRFGTKRNKPPKTSTMKRSVKSKLKVVTKRSKVPIRMISGVKSKLK